jgi:hypothetical protein
MHRGDSHELRAGLRSIAGTSRERECGVRAVSLYPAVQVSKGRASYLGMLQCGHIWTCPVCSLKLRVERAGRAAGAMTVGAGRWQMLTVTLRHRKGMNLPELFAGLTKAWRRTRQGNGGMQHVWSRKVTASIRASEITWGANGWHPHIHVVLRTEEWDWSEQHALLGRWKAAVVRELGAECRPEDEHALHWSEPIDTREAKGDYVASYVSKLGLEVSGIGKDARPKSREDEYRAGVSPWRIAWKATRRVDEESAVWRRRWTEYAHATRGRQMIALDNRASAWADKSEPVQEDRRIDEPKLVELFPEEVRALRWGERTRPTLLHDLLRSVEGSDNPRGVVDAWLRYAAGHGAAPALELDEARGGGEPSS